MSGFPSGVSGSPMVMGDRCGPCLVWAPPSLCSFQGGGGVIGTGQVVGKERSGVAEDKLGDGMPA